VLIGEDYDVQAPAVSEDGRWIAYESYESGQPEIVVRPFPNVSSGSPVQVSRAGGVKPQWSRSGTELFYLEPEEPGRVAMIAVSYRSESRFVPEAPRRLFAGNYPRPVAGRQIYSVSADGQRFLMYRNVAAEGDSRPRIIVVENWLEELQRRIPRP